MKARIYERRSDLSPDGKHLIYFAMNGRWDSETRGSWTAISRAPYLKALVLFPKGDCWFGGGLFTGRGKLPWGGSYWLNHTGDAVLSDSSGLRRDRTFQPKGAFGGECLSVYFPRLIRDGWQHLGPAAELSEPGYERFEKAAAHGWRLRKVAHAQVNPPVGKGCYWDEHALVQRGGESLPRPDWEWAEVDDERIVYASGGKLKALRVNADSIGEETELHDFNGMEFTAIEAPY